MDGVSEMRGAELLLPDVGLDFRQPDETSAGCEAGEGCFLDPCESNDDCLSGWCVDHMGEKVCTVACQAECPPGWECQQVAGTDPDLVFVCVSNVANLCRPCATGADCKSVGGAEDVCVDYGDEGSFCGGACVTGAECPWGFSCVETTTVNGISTKQCVADAGVCPCTGTSVKLALWTPCEVENEFGLCEGKRVCAEEGLTDCDASVPAPESCNGVDDDCDGDVDEGELVNDKYVSLCDDGNPCTTDQCLGESGCDYVALEEGECQDGNPCTVADHCEAGVCVGDPVECDDGNPCTDNVCTEKGGCEYPPVAGECDDGEACTLGDHCVAGECVGTEVDCDCEKDGDCVALEDGNLCNGTLFCNTGKVPFLCQVEPGTEVTCPEPEGPDAPCLAASCDPSTGSCSFLPANGGKPCDDGDLCTLGDSCLDGTCQGGTAANCNDGNPCTDDSCDPDSGCVHTPNAAPCSDGDVCTTADHCLDGECSGGPPLECDDGNFCNGQESCDPATGCKAGQPLACDDGNICNGVEGCKPDLGCQPGKPLVCDDGNACNGSESCDAVEGCQPGQPLSCDDGNVCNGKESCDPAAGCQAGAPLSCDDGNVCTIDTCEPGAGCVHGYSNDACDDGNACTLGDHCAEGKCIHEGLVKCDDGNVCTTDSCDPVSGCLHLLNKAPCDDGNVCTTGDKCNLGECVGSGTLACNDANPCTADSCDPDIGCEFVPQDGVCDDGTACTLGDTCFNGQCVATSFADCDDGNLCTDDSCDPKLGCINAANVLPCDDGDACTLADQCGEGLCVGTGTPDCDDGNLCTDDSCNPAVGCVSVNNTLDCNDGNKCTPFDQCKDGACVGSGAVDCNDDNPCTDESCDPALGCLFVDNDVACDDGSVCTLGDQCAEGACQPGTEALSCDDSEPCTVDSCDPTDGCIHTPLPDGTDCGGGKSCQSGVCTSPCEPGNQTFNYTGGQQTFVVPNGCETVKIEAWGAKGGNRPGYSAGGNGGYATGTLSVTPGSTLYVYVGQYPGAGTTAGWNGGGQGDCGGHSEGGGGGGASDVRVGGTGWNDRVIVAAGGGGGGGMHQNDKPGGGGGGLTGAAGTGCAPGQGGTQDAGGTKGTDSCNNATSTDGIFGVGGCGASGGCGAGGGGGGGGGWYGGGGGGTCGSGGSGAGGGSSYLGGVSDGSTQTGVNGTHGKIVLTWP
jgi:hypothetical protein